MVLVGPAGCGKSTFAEKHFLKTQIVSSDECRALVSDDAANQGVSGHAFDLMHFIIEKRLYLGRLTVADATNLRRNNREKLASIARGFHFNTAAIIFNLSLETCMARNQARARVVPQDALRAQYELLKRTLESVGREQFDYVFIIDDATESDVSVTIERAVNRQPGPQAQSPQSPP